MNEITITNVYQKESEADFEFELRRVHGESANPSMSMPSELFHSTVENVRVLV
jgi:hypothetical protein